MVVKHCNSCVLSVADIMALMTFFASALSALEVFAERTFVAFLGLSMYDKSDINRVSAAFVLSLEAMPLTAGLLMSLVSIFPV